MKIYLSKINESWIVDRVRKEWYQHNEKVSTEKIKEADILWIIAPWIWIRASFTYEKKQRFSTRY